MQVDLRKWCRAHMENLNNASRMHKISLSNRRTCTINGVSDVLAFDIHEVLLETEQGFQIHYLKPGQKPAAVFKTTEPVVAAYEYCNLHGLWMAAVE